MSEQITISGDNFCSDALALHTRRKVSKLNSYAGRVPGNLFKQHCEKITENHLNEVLI